MAKPEIYWNERAEHIKSKGWEMKGLPYVLNMHPDLVRERHLKDAVGLHEAYLQIGIDIEGSKKTLVYALKRIEENELAELAAFGEAHKPKA